jgi:outer membrane protein, heavy metal efflux system
VLIHMVIAAGAVASLASPRPPLCQIEQPGSDTVLTRLTAQALAANPGLAGDAAKERAARERIGPAGALPDPMLSAGVMDLALPHFAFRQSDFTEVDLELSQDLHWPGTLGARANATRAQARSASADVAARRREIVVRTAELYYRLRYLVTARATLQQQRRLLASAVEIATTRYATTSAPQSDPLQARVSLARLDADDVDFAEQEAKTRAELKALRNVHGPERLYVDLLRPEIVLQVQHQPGADAEPTRDSISAHPRLASRQAAVEAAEQMVRAEQLSSRPDFSITTRYGARPLGSDFFSAFVGIRLPLWASRKQNRLTDAARAEADAARAALAEERVNLNAELETARAEVAAGQARLRLLTYQVIPSAQATVDAALRSYRVGQTPFLNVIAAEDSLYRAELDAVMVAAEHLVHLVMVEQLLLPEDRS